MGQLSLLFSGKKWAEELGHGLLGETEVVWLFSQQGSGLHALKFKMALPTDFYDPVLKAGSRVEAFRGSKKLGTVTLSEPNRIGDAWSFEADGLYRKAETTVCNDAVGNSTSDITVGIESANLRGLGWNGAGDLEFEQLEYQALEDQGDKATIAMLFNNYCKLTGHYWGLDENDVPFIRPRPTVPEWAVTPGIPLPPTVDEMSVRSVTIKYLTGGTTVAPTSWGFSTVNSPDEDDEGRDVFIDISQMGTTNITAGRVDAWAQDYYEQMQTRVAYTGDLELVPGQLTNTGSVPIDFWASPLEVVGKLGLHHGVIDKKRGLTDKTIEYPCGSVVFRDTPGGGSLTLAAVDFAPRRVPDIIAYQNFWFQERARGGRATTVDIFGLPPWYRG